MRKLISIILILLFASILFAQDEKDVHEFTMIHKIKTTPIKSQGKSGTCWVFATTSFVETELLRLGFYEVPVCARRHLSKPLKRMGLGGR